MSTEIDSNRSQDDIGSDGDNEFFDDDERDYVLGEAFKHG